MKGKTVLSHVLILLSLVLALASICLSVRERRARRLAWLRANHPSTRIGGMR